MIRAAAVVFLAVAVAGAVAGCTAQGSIDSEKSQTVHAPDMQPTPLPEQAPACLTMSATWVAHIQEFMEDGYTITRGAGVASGDRFYSVAVLYTSPTSEEILGSWGVGEDPSSETVSMVFPLDQVTASHTVVMMPVANVIAEASAGEADAITCLG